MFFGSVLHVQRGAIRSPARLSARVVPRANIRPTRVPLYATRVPRVNMRAQERRQAVRNVLRVPTKRTRELRAVQIVPRGNTQMTMVRLHQQAA